MTTREFAEKYGVSIRRVQKLIFENRIPFDIDSLTGYYVIPDDAEYPDDRRQTVWSRRYYGVKKRQPKE